MARPGIESRTPDLRVTMYERQKISVSSSALFHQELAVHKYILTHSECLLSMGAARQTLSSTFRMLTKGMRDAKLVFHQT